MHNLGKSFFGASGGITATDVKKLSVRDKLSDYLPYVDFHESDNAFLSVDNTLGYVWECVPYSFASEEMLKRMEKLLELKLPEDVVLSFHLYADPHVAPLLDSYKDTLTREAPLTKKSADEYSKFLTHSIHGINKMSELPLRNYRLFFSVKSSSKLREDQMTGIEESLSGANLSPVRLDKAIFVEFLRRLINGKNNTPLNGKTTKAKPLRKQIVEPDCDLSFPANEPCKIGTHYANLLTYQSLPSNTDLLIQNKLFGGYGGVADDANQIMSPYLFSVVITQNKAEQEIDEKAKVINGQQVVGKSARELNKRMEEFRWILDKKSRPEKLLHVMQTMWVFDTSIEKLNRSTSRIQRLASDADYNMQIETELKASLFIASLPLGFYNITDNMQLIDRYFILPSSSTAAILPLQADYSGAIRTIANKVPSKLKPVLVSIGRKGQIQATNVFDERSINHNFLITAGTGAGKSYFLNMLINNYYASGSLVRAVDIGYSLEKSCRMNKGKFLDIGKEKVVINPFFNQGKDKEDKTKDLSNCGLVIAEMVCSKSGERLSEVDVGLIKSAITYTVAQGNHIDGIDSAQNYLYNFKQLAKDTPIVEVQEVVDRAKKLAFVLDDYTKNGVYGRFFNGVSTFDISNDEFVVLELQELKEHKELFLVMVMQVVNAVTQDLYLSDRGQQRFVLFEEAAHYLKQQGHKDLQRLALIIEEGYRRARKHNGSFGAVLQSILDLEDFGAVGKVIRSNAEYKYYLQSNDYPEGAQKGLIQHQGLALELVSSVKNVKPYYSEIFFESSLGRGVGRICLDPWNYWVNTSSPTEVNQYYELTKQGMRPEQAIAHLSGISL